MTTPTGVLTPPGALYGLAAQFADDLDARMTAAVDQVLAAHAVVYERIRVEYEAVLDKIVTAQEAGTPISPAWLYQRTRLKQALAVTKTEIAGYAEYASEQVKQAQWAAVQASLKWAAKAGQTAVNETGVSATFLETDPETMRHLVGFLSNGTPLDTLLNGLGLQTADQIRRALVQGVALGKGVPWMRRQVEQSLQMPAWRAETILRTEAMRASRAATRNGYLANSDVLAGWVWTATLDARVCPCCLVMDGTEHPLHATLDGHPRCRCAMVPRTKTYAELLGEPDAEDLPDSRPPLRSGKAWLEQQTPATQRALLGPGKFRAWKSGALSLDDLVARTEDPAWGTMRRERSLREISLGVHPNYPDVEVQPAPQVAVRPQPHVVHMMTANFTAADVEDLIDPNGDPQHQANLKAALATLLNDGPEQGPTLPTPQDDVVDAWVAKMNAALDSKGYPSKGYSQTVAIYKARANGTPGTKVGIIQSLTWQDKINGQEALKRHDEYREQWLAEQEAKAQAAAEAEAQAKAAYEQAKAVALNLWAQYETNSGNAQDHGMHQDAYLGAKQAALFIPDPDVRQRFLDRLSAAQDTYAQQRLQVLDLRTLQGPLWQTTDEDGHVFSMTLDADGWAVVTLDGGDPVTLKPSDVLSVTANPDAGWAPHYEPDPAKVANLVGILTSSTQDGYGYLDVPVYDATLAALNDPNSGWSGQHKANVQAALKQAQVTLLPPPETDVVDQNYTTAENGGPAFTQVLIDTFQNAINADNWSDNNGKSVQQNKSNALATLKDLKALKASQDAQASAAVEPPDPMPFPITSQAMSRFRVSLKQAHEGKAPTLIQMIDDGVFQDADVHAVKVALHLHALDVPPWKPDKWPWHRGWLGVDGHESEISDADRAKIKGFLDDLNSGKVKPATLAKSIGPNNVQGNKAKHAALTRYYWAKDDLGLPGGSSGPAGGSGDAMNPKPGDVAMGIPWEDGWPKPDQNKVDEYLAKIADPTQTSWNAEGIKGAFSDTLKPYATPKMLSNYWAVLKTLDDGSEPKQDPLNPKAGDTAYGVPWDPSWPKPDPPQAETYAEMILDPDNDEWDVPAVKAALNAGFGGDDTKADYWGALKLVEQSQGGTSGGGKAEPLAYGVPKDPSWPDPGPVLVQDWKDALADGSWTLEDAKALLTDQHSSGILKHAVWEALYDHQQKSQGGTPTPATQPATAAPSTPVGPFGNPPDPADLTFTGQTLGTHGAKVYTDKAGGRWLYKPPKDPRDQFLVDADVAASVLQAKSGLAAPETFAIDLGGQRGSIQKMYDAQPAFSGGFRPADLTQPDLLAVQQQHVLDWLLGNHDGHLEQFLRRPDGTLVGIDKGQAFRWYGQDRLDWDFHPNGYYGAPPPVYNALYREFAQGGAVEVLDPRSGPLADYISSLEDLSDDDLRALFRPYAEKAAARGLLAKHGQPQPGLTQPTFADNDVTAFLDALVDRKNRLGEDFTALYERAAKQREKNKPGWKATKPAPTKAQTEKAALKALKGAPEPVKPIAPDPPDTALPDNHWDAWLADAEARYAANPNKNKANLAGTANWSRFQRVMQDLDRKAVDELHQRQYLSDEMRDQALALIDQAEQHRAALKASYDLLYADYERALARWSDLVERWRKANGIVIRFAGMDDGVLRHSTDKAGVQWADGTFRSDRYTAGQRKALNEYTGSIHATWNAQLRRTDGDPGPYKATLDKIDQAMTVQAAPEDVILHRGTVASGFRLNGTPMTMSNLDKIVGTVQKDEAYMSSSVGNSAAFDSYEVQMKIRAPKGTPMAYVRTFSRFTNEREMLLGRGQRYYVHAAYKVNNPYGSGFQWCVEVEIVDKDWTPPLDAQGKPLLSPSASPWTNLRKDGTFTG